jgi:hypothetical protein
MDDYRGREVLELLQNADDAGVDYGLNKAIVRCWPEGLCVANTGVPFSGAGVESLLISNLSPKKLDRSRHIGNRGLDFRSILAWTNSPFILSGNFRLAFSPMLVSRQLEHVMQKSADLRARVQEWRENGDQTPMPILACPSVLNEQGEDPGFQTIKPVQTMWAHACELWKEYDTVVAIPFTESHAPKRLQEQLEVLNGELLLFLNHLEEFAVNVKAMRLPGTPIGKATLSPSRGPTLSRRRFNGVFSVKRVPFRKTDSLQDSGILRLSR